MAQQFFDDARIRKYLLGDISQEDQERIEQRLLIDEEFGEKLSMTRTEMVDAYVAAGLSTNEREEFEKHFLSTPEHVQVVEIARALAKRLDDRGRELPITGGLSTSPNIPTPYYMHMKAIISLTVGMILLVVGYAVWEIVKQRPSNNRVNDHYEQQAILENEVIKLNRPATGSARTGFAVVSLNLKPILVRDVGEKRSLVIPKDPSIFELRLELPNDKYQSYRASLQTDEGVELAVIDALTAKTLSNAKVVVLDLPSWLMRPGSYQIKLTGILTSGEYEDVSVYPFEITNR
jgi:hypothetical protein